MTTNPRKCWQIQVFKQRAHRNCIKIKNEYKYNQPPVPHLVTKLKMNKIIDRVYLGSLEGASDMPALKAAGITHILQVASGMEPLFPEEFNYKVISVTDTDQSSIIEQFPVAIAFIKEGITKGGGVLVHCYAGVSRSASCVIAYLMQEKEMTFESAFAFASKRRPEIFPNKGF